MNLSHPWIQQSFMHGCLFRQGTVYRLITTRPFSPNVYTPQRSLLRYVYHTLKYEALRQSIGKCFPNPQYIRQFSYQYHKSRISASSSQLPLKTDRVYSLVGTCSQVIRARITFMSTVRRVEKIIILSAISHSRRQGSNPTSALQSLGNLRARNLRARNHDETSAVIMPPNPHCVNGCPI